MKQTYGHPSLAEDSGNTAATLLSSQTYDAFGRLHQRADHTAPAAAGSRTLTYGYDGGGQLITVTYPPVDETKMTTFVVNEYDAAVPGLLAAVTNRAGERTSYTYNNLLQPKTQTSSAGLVTTTTYDALGRLSSRALDYKDGRVETTHFEYDRFDQLTAVIHPDHVPDSTSGQPGYHIETRSYDPFGNLKAQSGAGQYPIAYDYDLAGNLTAMTTYYGSDGTAATTRWKYNSRNQISQKTYPDTKTYQYTYDPVGNLSTRTDSKNRLTTYHYNNKFNQLTGIDYPSDNIPGLEVTTPSVQFAYDDAGRRRSMSDGTGATTWTYDPAGRVRTFTQHRLNTVVDYQYDAEGNRRALYLYAPGQSRPNAPNTAYTYDSAGRLHTLTDAAVASQSPFIYHYRPKTPWVQEILTPTGSSTYKDYDNAGRLLGIQGRDRQGQSFVSYGYQYNLAGQRSQITGPMGTLKLDYDEQRQLTSAVEIDTSGDPVSGTAYDYGYTYDPIGNRLTGDVGREGQAPLSVDYTPNNLNQYTGIADATPGYDANGNLTSHEGRDYFYDDENRLVEIRDTGTGNTISKFLYDGLGRRVQTLDYAADGATIANTVNYLYDGLLVLEELDGSGQVSRHITRGLDLSGTMQGAGGIGGILATTDNASNTAYFCYDGNGNVVNLIDGADQIVADYRYDPFGNRVDDPTDDIDNPYQWSTKETHTTTGLVYYLYRYYSPKLGRWINRDPIEEDGGENLYGSVFNDPASSVDSFGQIKIGGTKELARLARWLGPPAAAAYLTEVARTRVQNRGVAVGKLIYYLGTQIFNSVYGRTFKVGGLYTKLANRATSLKAVSWSRLGYPGPVEAFYLGRAPGASPLFIDWLFLPGGTLNYSDYTKGGVIVHEVVHAYNAAYKTGVSNPNDEGMAYTINWLTENYEIDTIPTLEKLVKAGSNDKWEMGRRWEKVWERFAYGKAWNALRETPGDILKGGGIHPIKESSLTDIDIMLVNHHFGTELSCPRLAEAYNKILRRSGSRLCFTCEELRKSQNQIPMGWPNKLLPKLLKEGSR